MQSQIWSSTIPLHITHESTPTPYLIQVPRLSYLPLLIPRLNAFFGLVQSFSYQGILLKNLPVGLLFDLYKPDLPWKIELGNGDLFDIHDTYINSVKEADFIRYGSAKGIQSMSKDNTTQLWDSVQDNDYNAYNKINRILLNPASPLKNIPLRIYVPTSPTGEAELGSFKIVQTLVPPFADKGGKERQTLGSALHRALPSLFTSTRDILVAEPILHGAPVPLRAPLEELMKEAAYADGWLHLTVNMMEADDH